MNKSLLIAFMAFVLCESKVHAQADCNNVFLDETTFQISYFGDSVVNGYINYLDTTFSVYPVLHLILLDTSVILSPDYNFLTMLQYPIDSIEPFTFEIEFKSTDYEGGTVVPALFHVWDSDMPGDSIVTCYIPVTIILDQMAAVHEPDVNRSVTLFPNPASDVITIQSVEHLSNVFISVMNVTGEEMISDEQFSGTEFQLDVSDLPAGIYITNILNGEQIIYTERFVIY